MALSNDAGVRMRAGVKSSHTISTMRRPAAAHIRMWLESTAGIDDAPGSARPSASAIAIMVAAVPITMQVPKLRAMPPSISAQSFSVMLPARFSSQYFQASEPEPRVSPRSEEHTSELQSRLHLVCRLLLEKKKKTAKIRTDIQQNHNNK